MVVTVSTAKIGKLNIQSLKGMSMNKNIASAFASIEFEGLIFTEEQKQFLIGLIKRIDNKEITWDEAVKIVKERHNAKSDNNKSVSL